VLLVLDQYLTKYSHFIVEPNFYEV